MHTIGFLTPWVCPLGTVHVPVAFPVGWGGTHKLEMSLGVLGYALAVLGQGSSHLQQWPRNYQRLRGRWASTSIVSVSFANDLPTT